MARVTFADLTEAAERLALLRRRFLAARGWDELEAGGEAPSGGLWRRRLEDGSTVMTTAELAVAMEATGTVPAAKREPGR